MAEQRVPFSILGVIIHSDHKPNEDVTGSINLTKDSVAFTEPSGRREIWLLYSLIHRLEKLPVTARGIPLKFICKHFLKFTIFFSEEKLCQDVLEAVQALMQPNEYESLYAFRYTPKHPISKEKGWKLFKPEHEFARMGLPNKHWCLSELNKEYQLCDTYPSVLVLPTSCSEEVVFGSAKFRSRMRLPSLTYFYEPKGTSLCRCSQPLSGMSKRSQEDEDMIMAISKTTPDKDKVYIIDVRPKANAWGNKVAGKGFEAEGNYTSADFYFIGIHNIHVMRESLGKLTDAAESKKMSTYYSLLESSNWFQHIRAILEASTFLARALVIEGKSVIVHCSDGWDRTSQTCSIAELIVDPYYRTLHGFMILIEREWLSFGHKFSGRHGHLATNDGGKDVSPVFLQFLECVWQIKQQYPTAFQFNTHFLLILQEHVNSCQFGTFLGNCERERKILQLSEKTSSIWNYMYSKEAEFRDPLYDPNSSEFIFPSTDIRQFKLWRDMYCQFHSAPLLNENIEDVITGLCQYDEALEDHCDYLQQTLTELKQSLEADTPPTPLMREVYPIPIQFTVPRCTEQCVCKQAFSLTNRRLTCSNCGNLACTTCLRLTAVLPWRLPKVHKPICKRCRNSMSQL